MAAGGSMNSHGSATDFVSEDIVGLSNALHFVVRLSLLLGGLGSGAGTSSNLLTAIVPLLLLLVLLVVAEDVVRLTGLLLGLVILTVVISTEGE